MSMGKIPMCKSFNNINISTMLLHTVHFNVIYNIHFCNRKWRYKQHGHVNFLRTSLGFFSQGNFVSVSAIGILWISCLCDTVHLSYCFTTAKSGRALRNSRHMSSWCLAMLTSSSPSTAFPTGDYNINKMQSSTVHCNLHVISDMQLRQNVQGKGQVDQD